ncbi:MAG: hypothetical protein UY65_C0030G0008 [Parcubacteria group bacterium GW2011_GWA2_51_12]|nr:MAG: hypothetical protein UY65_C0030G0008 [Parcubacteria group bacterium GW2011_GWA2_51_12]
MEKQQQQIQLRIRDDEARGVYSNAMRVKHSKEEFCLDFLNIFPPLGAVTARVIMSPGHLKRMLKALNENLDIYEKAFGPVDIAPEPSKGGFGFSTQE